MAVGPDPGTSTAVFAVREGEVDPSFFIIARGSFEVLVPTGDGPQRVRVLEPGEASGRGLNGPRETLSSASLEPRGTDYPRASDRVRRPVATA